MLHKRVQLVPQGRWPYQYLALKGNFWAAACFGCLGLVTVKIDGVKGLSLNSKFWEECRLRLQ